MNDIFSSDEFSLVRHADGERIDSLRGIYDAIHQNVILYDEELHPAIGDTLIHHLPGDKEKSLTVTDVEFLRDPFTQPHVWYQLTVRSKMEHASVSILNYGTIQQIGRRNTIIHGNIDTELFRQLRETVTQNSQALGANFEKVLAAIKELEYSTNKSTPEFKEKILEISALAANITTVLVPILSRLL